MIFQAVGRRFLTTLSKPPTLIKQIDESLSTLKEKSELVSTGLSKPFYRTKDNYYQQVIPRIPKDLPDDGPNDTVLKYMHDLSHHNFLNYKKLNETMQTIFEKYPNDPEIKVSMVHRLLRGGSYAPYYRHFHQNTVTSFDYHHEIFESFATSTNNISELKKISLWLHLMIDNDMSLDTQLVNELFRVVPLALKEKYFPEQYKLQVENAERFQTYDQIKAFIEENPSERLNHEHFIIFNELAVKEERYREYLDDINSLIFVSKAEIPIGALKHCVELVDSKRLELNFPFSHRLSMLSGSNLFPFTIQLVMDRYLRQKTVTTEQIKLMNVLSYSDIAGKVKIALICKKLNISKKKFVREPCFDEYQKKYIKTQHVFKAGGDEFQFIRDYPFDKSPDQIDDSFTQFGEKSNLDVFNECSLSEEKKFYPLINRLITGGDYTFAISASILIKEKFGINLINYTKYQVLLKLLPLQNPNNLSFISYLKRSMFLAPWSSEILDKYPFLSSLNNNTREYDERISRTLDWSNYGKVIFKMTDNQSPYKILSMKINPSFVPEDLLTTGLGNVYWRQYCKNSGGDWSDYHEHLIDFYAKRGKIYFLVAFLNSRMKIDQRKLFTKIYEAFGDDDFIIKTRNIIGLNVVNRLAKQKGFIVPEELQAKINERVKGVKEPKEIEDFNTFVRELQRELNWNGFNDIEFRLDHLSEDFIRFSRIFNFELVHLQKDVEE